MKKVLIVIIVFYTIAFLGCMGSCPPVEKPYFNITGMEVTARRDNFETPSYAISNNEEIPWNEMFFELWFNVDYHALNKKSTGSFFTAAHALTCDSNGQAGSREKLKDITVITLNDYNATFKANDTINAIMMEGKYYSRKSLDDFVQQDTLTINYTQLRLSLTEKPEFETSQFRIVVELENGEIYSADTNTFILK